MFACKGASSAGLHLSTAKARSRAILPSYDPKVWGINFYIRESGDLRGGTRPRTPPRAPPPTTHQTHSACTAHMSCNQPLPFLLIGDKWPLSRAFLRESHIIPCHPEIRPRRTPLLPPLLDAFDSCRDERIARKTRRAVSGWRRLFESSWMGSEQYISLEQQDELERKEAL